MRFLLLVLNLILITPLAHSADRYSCLPESGKENFKNSELYFVVRDGRRVSLVDATNAENTWNYDVYYSDDRFGFRAVRSAREGVEPIAKMSSIAIGGSLYFMSFRQGPISVLVTYQNALKENASGSMRLTCSK